MLCLQDTYDLLFLHSFLCVVSCTTFSRQPCQWNECLMHPLSGFAGCSFSDDDAAGTDTEASTDNDASTHANHAGMTTCYVTTGAGW